MPKSRLQNGPDESHGASRGRDGSSLDHTDREILRFLRIDGRTSNVNIARQLGVTETTVRKRIAALLSDGLVEIVAVPTPKLAGLQRFGDHRHLGAADASQRRHRGPDRAP